MEGANLETVIFKFLLAFSICGVLYAQPGFISLDCGGEGKYEDSVGISWTSDEQYIKTGEKKSVLAAQFSSRQTERELPLKDLRCFPQGKRNCYNLPAVRGTKYIIRVGFLYGNYDGLQSLPQFELLVDANPWITLVVKNSSEIISKGIFYMARGPSIDVCLARTTDSVPFISSLELRPLKQAMYETVGQDFCLLSVKRIDYGSFTDTLRYPDDPFDRLWRDEKTKFLIDSIWLNEGLKDLVERNTTNSIDTDKEFEIPSAALQTALATPNNSGGNITWSWSVADIGKYYFVMCFAEVEQLGANAIREFTVTFDGNSMLTVKLDGYLSSFVTPVTWEISGPKQVKISLNPTNRSTVGAILNGVDIYKYSSPLINGTNSEDVNAVADIARHFNLEKEWTGDPCLPQKYSWDWVDCNQDSSPRIIAVTLPDKGLNGTIPSSFGNLSALVKLDLARNKLSGSIPELLATLSNLTELNLTDNDLNGPVPNGLSEKQQRGQLNLSVDGNEMLCQTGICKDTPKRHKSKSLLVWLIVAGIGILITITAILMYIKLKSNKKILKEQTETEHLDLVELDVRRSFSYKEVRIMTRSFQTEIGRGGFGPVFLGCLQGRDVAVKILSEKSHQGAVQFSTEVNILSKLHHKNLVKFMGYCTEEQNLVLIYEYMSNGDLRHCLDGQTSSKITLEWERRLSIALDAAQGLEYLHVGCTPGVIHRDVKSSNILLNDQMEAKIADFGLSKILDGVSHVSTLVKGTTGYLDPEYYTTHRLTKKSDVYSFGVVLMEIISGRHPHFVDHSTFTGEYVHIASWVRASLLKEDIENIADPILLKNYNKDAMQKVAELAMVCTSPYSENRPTMNEVVLELKEASGFQTHHYPNMEFHEFAPSHVSLKSSVNVDSDVSLYSVGR